MTELTNSAIYQILLTMVRFLGLLPREALLSLGKVFGLTSYALDGRHRRVALRNLAMTMPGMSGQARIAREVFVNIGILVSEFIYFHGGGSDRFNRFISISGLSHYQSAKGKGRGVLCLTAHFGNWELLALSVSVLVSPVSVIMRPLDFEPLNRVVAFLRTRHGNHLIPKKNALKSSIRALKRGETIGVLHDQKDSWRLGVYVEFLGQPACANKGMALMALRTGAPVVPVFMIRKKDYRYEIVFEPELELIRTGDLTRDVEENTALFTKVIERYVRKYPGQWLWVHNRWEKKPYEVWPRKS